MRHVFSPLPLGALAAVLFLAGCEQPPAATRVAADGTVLVEIGPGLRCHNGQCIEFDALWDRARITPFDFVRLPDNIRVTGGVLTEAQFQDVYNRARRAPLGGRGTGDNF